MNLKIAKQICKLQGIKPHLQIKAICPLCSRNGKNNKTLLLKINRGIAYCMRCDREWKLSEILAMEEEDWLEKHEHIEQNKGVGY